nr:tape measure protein [Azospirillum sp. A1-3]
MGAGVGAIAGGIALLAAASIKAGDELTKTEGRLAAVTGSVGAARETYDGLYQISQKTGIAVADSANQFVRFNIAAGEIGATRREVLQLVETVQKFGVVSGISTQEAQAGAQQLGQALASGKLQGDELRSILENMPVMARALAKELGVGIGQLKEMGSAGELTADKVFRALLRASTEANAAFEAMPMTVERASSIMASSWGRFVAEIDRSLQRSQSLANTIKYVADQLDRLAKNQTTSGQFDNISKQITELEAYKKQLKQELSDNNGWGFSVGTFLKNNSELADIDKRIARLQATRDVLGENVREEQRLAAQMQQSDRARTASAAAAAAQTAAQGAYKDAVKGLFPLEDALTERNKKRADVMSALDAGLISFAQAQKDNAAIEEAYQAKVESVTHAQRDAEKAAGDREKAEAKLEKQILSAVKAADAKAVEEYNKVMNEGKRVYDSTRTPAEKYADTLVDLNRLLNAGAIDQDTFNRAVQQSDPAFQEAKKAAEKYQQEIQSTAKDIARDWSETLYDAMILQDKQASIIDAIKALGKRIAVALLEANIVLPITTAVVGSVPGLFGIQGGGSAANQNGGMGGAGNLLSIGSKFMPSSWTSGITGAIDQFGASAFGIGSSIVPAVGGQAATVAATTINPATGSLAAYNSWGAAGAQGASAGLSSYLGPLGAGFAVGGLLGPLLANGNKAVGGLAGGASGAAAGALVGSMIPGVGTLIGALIGGAGGGLGGLIGTQKPSVGKTASSDVTIASNGKSATYGNILTDNEGDPEAGKALGNYISSIFTTAAAGGGRLTKDFGFGQTAKDGYYIAGSVDYKKFGDDFAAMMRYALIDQGGLKDGGKNTLAAITNSKNKDAEEFGKDVALGASIDAGNTALREMVKTLSGVTDAAKKATTESFKPMFEELERAKKLGIDGAYVGLASEQLKAYLDQLRNPPDFTQTQQDMATLTGQFQAAREAYAQLNPAMVTYVDQIEAETRARMAANLNKSLDQQIAEASGRGYVNQISGFLDTLTANGKSLAAVGEPVTRAQTLFNAQLAGLLKTLDDTQRADVVATFGGSISNLSEVMQQAANDNAEAAAEAAAKAASDIRSSWSSVVSSALSSAQSVKSAWENTAKSLASARQQLLVGDLSPLSPLEKYNAAKAQFNAVSSAAAGGDQDAMSQLATVAQSFLTASKAYNATNTAYASDFSVATDALQHSESIASQQLTAAKSQVSYLSSIDSSLKSLDANMAEQAQMASVISTPRNWGASGSVAANMQLALKTGYSGDFGGGGWQSWITQQDDSTKAIARQVLAAAGQSWRINGFATGTPAAPPGWAWVGEQGPELMQMKGGEPVIPNAAAVSMARSWEAANDRWGGNVVEYRPRQSSQSSGGGSADIKRQNELLEEQNRLLTALLRTTAAAGDGTLNGLAEVADNVKAVAKKASGGGLRE